MALIAQTDRGSLERRLLISDLTEQTREELPDDPSGVKQLAVPSGVSAVMTESEHSYRFQAKKGQVLAITCLARALGSPLDVAIQLNGPDNNGVANNDDLPGTTDAGLEFAAPADGDYTLVVSDKSGRGGSADAIYRVAIEPAAPDFTLTAPQVLALPLGGKAELAIKCQRHGGLKGEIGIRVEGLPKGITVPAELKIPADKADFKIPFEAAADASTRAVLIRLTGTATVDDGELKRVAKMTAAGNLCPRHPDELATNSALLAITMAAPLTIDLVGKNRQRAVNRGTTYPAELTIKRNEGFTGEVTFRMLARQSRHRQGITGPILTVPADSDPCALSLLHAGMARDRSHDPDGADGSCSCRRSDRARATSYEERQWHGHDDSGGSAAEDISPGQRPHGPSGRRD